MSVFKNNANLSYRKYSRYGKPAFHGWTNAIADFLDGIFSSQTDIKIDTISESTEGAGVTIDGVVIKDGNITVNGDNIPEGGISLGPGIVQYSKTISISSDQVVNTDAGGLSHTDGLVLVPPLGEDVVIDLMSAILIYEGSGVGYTAGGNVTVNIAGGTALTGLVSVANSFGAVGNKIYRFLPLSDQTTAAQSLPVNTGINLHSAAPFTNTEDPPATGTAVVRVIYNVITTGL